MDKIEHYNLRHLRFDVDASNSNYYTTSTNKDICLLVDNSVVELLVIHTTKICNTPFHPPDFSILYVLYFTPVAMMCKSVLGNKNHKGAPPTATAGTGPQT